MISKGLNDGHTSVPNTLLYLEAGRGEQVDTLSKVITHICASVQRCRVETGKPRDILTCIQTNTGQNGSQNVSNNLWTTIVAARIFVLLYGNLKPVISPRAPGIGYVCTILNI